MSGACSTCVYQYDGCLVGLAAGGSNMSIHPDFCRLKYEQFIFNECVPGVLNAGKLFLVLIVT